MSGGASTEQTATHATGTCALSVLAAALLLRHKLRRFFFFPAEHADVLLDVLRKRLPKDMVRLRRSFGTVRSALAGDGDLKALYTHETKWRANDGGHDRHLADVVRPR